MMTAAGTCPICARLVELTIAGTVKLHDTVGPIIRSKTRKRKRLCAGSGMWPREAGR